MKYGEQLIYIYIAKSFVSTWDFVIKDVKLRVECSPLLEFLLSIIPAIRYRLETEHLTINFIVS